MKRCFTIFLFLISLISSSARATEAVCTDSSIVTSRRLIDPLDVSSKQINFKYRFLKGEPGYPVIIQIPGGPGGASITLADSRFDRRVGWIQIDPRNTGCNDLGLSAKYISTANEVYDISEIIKEQNLTNYVIFGGSYGTVVATQLAYATEVNNLSKPKATILEGVLGRAFLDLEQENEFINQWQPYRSQFNSEMNSELLKDSPFGIPTTSWVAYFTHLLYIGVSPTYGNLADVIVNLLNDPTSRNSILNDIRQTQADKFSDVFQTISCTELTENAGELTMINGNFIASIPQVNMCENIPLSKPFNSADYQISTPLFYFNGSNDPATPLAQAMYHFTHQTNANKVFVEVRQGGHNALKINLADCYPEIMRSIVLSEFPLKTALSKCKMKIVLH